MADKEKKEISRRKFLKIAGAGAVVVAAAAVGGYYALRPSQQANPTPSPTPTTSTTPSSGGPKFSGSVNVAGMDACVVQFKWLADQMKNDIGVTVTTIEVPWGDCYTKFMLDLTTGTGAYDLMTETPLYNADLVNTGNLELLDDYITKYGLWIDDFNPKIMPYVMKTGLKKARGKFVGVLCDGDTFVTCFQKPLFDNQTEKDNFKSKYGYDLAPPQTWDQYLDIAEFFTRKAGDKLAGQTLDKDFYGCSGEITEKYQNHGWWAARWASGMGKDVPKPWFDEDLNPTINTESGVLAIEHWKKLMKFCPPGANNFDWTTQHASWLAGNGAMVWTYWLEAKGANNPSVSKIVGKSDFSNVPGSWNATHSEIVYKIPMQYMRNLWLSKLSKNKEAGFAVIRYMTSPEISPQWTFNPSCGNEPFRLSTIKDAQYISDLFKSQFDVDFPVAIVQHWLDAAKFHWNHPIPDMPYILSGSQYKEALNTHLSAALTGTEDPEKALNAAASEWNQITNQAGKAAQLDDWSATIALYKEAGIWPTA